MMILGILGGMGPMAGVNFAEILLRLSLAKKDQGHLPFLLSNACQIPDRNAFLMGESNLSPAEALVTEAQPHMFDQMLGTAEADFYGHQTKHGSFVFGGSSGLEPFNKDNGTPVTSSMTAPCICRGIMNMSLHILMCWFCANVCRMHPALSVLPAAFFCRSSVLSEPFT